MAGAKCEYLATYRGIRHHDYGCGIKCCSFESKLPDDQLLAGRYQACRGFRERGEFLHDARAASIPVNSGSKK